MKDIKIVAQENKKKDSISSTMKKMMPAKKVKKKIKKTSLYMHIFSLSLNRY